MSGEAGHSPVPRRRWRGLLQTALLVTAVLLPLAVVGVSSGLSWRNLHLTAENELMRTADGAAEYAERVLSAQVLAARLVNQMLAGVTDDEIREREAELHSRLYQLIPSVPMATTITLADRDARVLVDAATYPAQPSSIADREWVRVLRGAAPSSIHFSAVMAGERGGEPRFAVSIRRSDTGNGLSSNTFDGVVDVLVDPRRVALGFNAVTHEPGDVISLIRADGWILARLPVFSGPVGMIPANSPLLEAGARGVERGFYSGRSLGLRSDQTAGQELKIAFRRVGAFPVYVAISRPPAMIAQRWREAVTAPVLAGLTGSLALAALAFFVRRSQRDLAASEAEFRATFESSVMGKMLLDPVSWRPQRVNGRVTEITGHGAAELINTRPIVDLLHPEDRAVVETAGHAALDAGATFTRELRLRRKDGTTAWLEMHMAPVIDGHSGRLRHVIVALQDIGERKAAEERQTLLAREVDHRAKNMLAVVQSIVHLTRADDPRAFAESVAGRVRALARAHELLARDRWRGTELAHLVQDELAGFVDTGADAGRITISGPPVRLAASAVQPLSMALHELATNAAKYGALSRPQGRLDIAWHHDAAARAIVIAWREQGGPLVTGPGSRQGFGLKLLQRLLEGQLGGTVKLDWRPGGLFCRLTLDFGHLVGAPPPPSPSRPGGPAPTVDADVELAGRRVLLVEDEPLVALDMAGTLADCGCEVVGPADSLAEALRLAEAADGLDAAVLDINLNGETSFPVADLLAAKGVPFIYATGYAEQPKERLAEAVALLRKPVAVVELKAALRVAIAARDENDGDAREGASMKESQ